MSGAFLMEGENMTIEVSEVTVYTKPNCVQCDMTKKVMDAAGIEYETDSLLDEGNLAAAKALGFLSAPVVMVGDEGWAGFQPEMIKDLAKRLKAEGK